MGNCICMSLNSPQVEAEATAKLMVYDGRLQEFSYPIKVSYLLQAYPGCFICNSDNMDFDNVVRAIRGNEVLQPGQLYFALPKERLNRPLKAAEMATLAVKASTALRKSGGEKFESRQRHITLFSGDENGRSCRKVAPKVVGAIDLRKNSRNSGGHVGRKAKFTAMLSSIPE